MNSKDSPIESKLSEILGENLGSEGYDLIDVVPIPSRGDRMLRLRTLQEILDDYDSNAPQHGSGYFIHIRPKSQSVADSDCAKLWQCPEGKTTPVNVQESVYLPDGKMNVAFLFQNAQLLQKSGETTLARSIYLAILQASEQPGQAHLGIAQTFETELKVDLAESSYRESIAYCANLEAFIGLSRIMARKTKFLDAAETLERALELQQLNKKRKSDLHEMAAEFWSKVTPSDRSSTAEEHHLREAIELNPSDIRLKNKLGQFYLTCERIEEAKRTFQDAMVQAGRHDLALAGLGHCALKEGEKRQAHDFFARSLDINLLNATAILNLVRCAYEIKSYATAARLVKEYTDVAPIDTHLLYSLAGLQFHLGKLQAAEATAKKLLELDTSHIKAKELLALIARYT